MNIIFRADASIHIGSGHVMRCLVLAKILSNKGHKVTFATRPQKGDFVGYIQQQSIQLIELQRTIESTNPQNENDYNAWLQLPWLEDANDFIQKAGEVDLVIVDHYGINKDWEKHVSQSLNCKIFVIDDLVREHCANLILDQTFGRQEQEYITANKETRILTGSHYSLLAPQYSELRIQAEQKKSISTECKVLVTMGAIDAPNVTLKVLHALSIIENINVTVLLSPRAPHYESVSLYCKSNPLITHIDFSEDVANLMLEHDVAIGAPGSTSWERACLGLPSIIIPIADNQADIAENIANAGAAIKLAIEDIEPDFKAAFKLLTTNWLEFRLNNFKITDGLGAFRVVEQIENLEH